MSWINLGEVHYVLRRLHGEEDASETVRDLRDVIDARLPDERLVLAAARIKAEFAMAYAVAFAAASAVAQEVTLWTGDPELLLELPDLTADARLGGIQHIGGGGDVEPAAGDLTDITQLLEVHTSVCPYTARLY